MVTFYFLNKNNFFVCYNKLGESIRFNTFNALKYIIKKEYIEKDYNHYNNFTNRKAV